ncbi:MAG TPA: hypothetical protein DCL73_15980 [Treponema sp.]|nr:hypothetical protein [Treponema sp.]
MSNELFSSGGYRLDVFQLYNWGIFNNAVYTIDCRRESSLLTGANGSGKTTVVDALLSLLVPYSIRAYNQSSGTDRKRDRTEETYVLGAYGSIQDEQSSSARMQSLRTRDTFSVLSGCFVNDDTQSAVSLLQVRYFSGDTLQHVYALTKQRVTLDDVNACLAGHELSIDRAGRWKKVVSESFGTIFFGDSFRNYSAEFSKLFGFRSDKALRLFSQTVGLKVLGNLTDFIRANMLEETDTPARFERLQSNYTKLMQSYNEIQKTKKQIELLEPIMDLGGKWKHEQDERKKQQELSDALPAWAAYSAIEILTRQQKEFSEKRLEEKEHEDVEVRKRNGIQKEIDSLKEALSRNETARRIQEIDNRIEQLTGEKNRIQGERDNFNKKLTAVGMTLPRTETEFSRNRKMLDGLRTKETADRQQLDGNLFSARTEFAGQTQTMETIQQELASLGTRTSNIPLENISIRAFLCRGIHCGESELPFAGELLCVAQDERQWNYAIEKLLHNFALDILVPEALYANVTSFVKSNNMRGRIVYLRTSAGFSLSTADALQCDKSTVPGKLLVKQNHPLTEWLTQYVYDHFNYLCTDDTKELSGAERALTSTGLIKNGIRHEKDDGRKIAGSFVQVLGWDNTEKRRKLSSDLDDLRTHAAGVQSTIAALNAQLAGSEERIRTLQNIAEVTSWDRIDTESRAKQIDSLQHEKESLESRATDIQQLRVQLEQKTAQYTESDTVIRKIAAELGVVESRLEEIESSLRENEAVRRTFCVDEALRKKSQEQIELLHAAYERLSRPQTIPELDADREKMRSDITSRANGCSQRIKGYELNLSQKMGAVKNPSAELRNMYGDWSAEFTDLGQSAESLDDYTAFYNRLKKDDLPRYSSQFREYLHDTMSEDVVDFKVFIEHETQEIRNAVGNLNSSLKDITYSRNPDTYLQLELADSTDVRIRDFKSMLRSAIPDALYVQQHDEEKEEQLFLQIKRLIDTLQSSENDRRFVLDIRNWFTFAAKEYFTGDGTQAHYYQDTSSLSGGQKAKLTYTILGSAIAYQFNIESDEPRAASFRFIMVDEAFSKSDANNSDYAMKLFDQLNLQVMVITPLDKINIVENYISSVHITENTGSNDSRLLHMTIDDYRSRQRNMKQTQDAAQ